jgi:hypothetical protein
MSNFLSQLPKSERARLLEELNYMNLEERDESGPERPPDRKRFIHRLS